MSKTLTQFDPTVKTYNNIGDSSYHSIHVRPILSPSAQQGLYLASLCLHIFPLRPGTKLPYRGVGVNQATDDQDKIREWVRKLGECNWGVACGPSNLLLLDFDTISAASLLSRHDLETWIVTTPGRQGKHVYYRQPPGAQLGCSRGSLPSGIDVKGHGGYVLAPGSTLEAGSYEFVKGKAPHNHPIAPLPSFIHVMLHQQEAPTKPTEAPGTHISNYGYYHANSTENALLALPERLQRLVHTYTPIGQRSTVDFAVVRSLVEVGATNAQITAIFDKYPVGDKHRQRGHKYLALTIRKARQAPSCRITAEVHPQKFIERSLCVDSSPLYEAGQYDDPAIILKSPLSHYLLTELLTEAKRKGSCHLTVSLRSLAMILNCAPRTIQRQLCKLQAAGLLTTHATREGTTVELSPAIGRYASEKSTRNSKDVGGVALLPSSKSNDVFARADYRTAQYRKGVSGPLLPSLGTSGRIVLELLTQAIEPLTLAQIVGASGLCDRTVRSTIAKLKSLGLLFITKRARAYVYELMPNAEDRLSEIAPEMQTWGIGNLRAGRSYIEIALWAHRQLEKRESLPEAQRATLQRRKERAWANAARCYRKACDNFSLPFDPLLPKPKLVQFFKYLDLRAAPMQLSPTIEMFT